MKKSASDISLSDTIDAEGDGDGLSVFDVVASDEDLAETVADRELCSRLQEYVESSLTEREAEVISLRYGLGGRKALTQHEAAQKLGISRSYVSRIEKKALEKLRNTVGESLNP